jgi:hypothetical protein
MCCKSPLLLPLGYCKSIYHSLFRANESEINVLKGIFDTYALCYLLAMLRKQSWNYLFNPDAKILRVLKAKYFSNGDFLGASLGHNPNYVWRNF